MATAAAVTFLQFGTTDGKNHQVFTLTKEQFMQVMLDNGIKCENCQHWTRTNYPVSDNKDGDCNYVHTYGEAEVEAEWSASMTTSELFFCKAFNRKSNG